MKNLVFTLVMMMALTSTARASCVDAPTFSSEKQKEQYVEKLIARIDSIHLTTKTHEQMTLEGFKTLQSNPRETLGVNNLDYEVKVKQYAQFPHATEVLLKWSPKLWDEAMTDQIDPIREQMQDRSADECTPEVIARMISSAKLNVASAYGQDVRKISSPIAVKSAKMPLEGVTRIYLLSMYEESILANQLTSILGGKGRSGLKPSALREVKSNLMSRHFKGQYRFQ